MERGARRHEPGWTTAFAHEIPASFHGARKGPHGRAAGRHGPGADQRAERSTVGQTARIRRAVCGKLFAVARPADTWHDVHAGSKAARCANRPAAEYAGPG